MGGTNASQGNNGEGKAGGADVADALLASIAETQIDHSRMLHAILGLLTEATGRDSGELKVLLAAMIARLGEQTDAVTALGTSLDRLRRDLPAALAAAADGRPGAARRPNGQNDGAAAS